MVIQRGLPAWPGRVTPGPGGNQAACEPQPRAAPGGGRTTAKSTHQSDVSSGHGEQVGLNGRRGGSQLGTNLAARPWGPWLPSRLRATFTT